MKKVYTAPELEVELFDTVVMDLTLGSDPSNPGGITDIPDDLEP